MGRLDGKVAIISGGARGQGAAEARLFVDEGASVVVGDVLDGQGRALVDDLGKHAHYVHLDVTNEDDWVAAVGAAQSEFGGLHVLVSNAGISRPPKPISELSLAEYMEVVLVNQVGTFLGLRAAIPAMTSGGSIITISSIAGLEGMAGLAPYVSSKFAVRGMTKVAALELARNGIRVNSVHPGAVDTPMLRPDDWHGVDIVAIMGAGTPMGRVGQPEEVARLVLFLASDESSYCTGAEFVVDGGIMAGTWVPSGLQRQPSNES